MAEKPFAGKVALVTGAGRGIGAVLAQSLAAQGASVAVNYAHSQAEAEAVAAAIRAAGGDAKTFQADIGSKATIDRMFAALLDTWGHLDILVNNAGFDPGATPFLEVDEALYDRVTDTNLKGAFFCTQAAARAMIARGEGGKIINISSVHARASVKHHGVYAATKGGLESLTRQLALELADYRIRVNAIAPGFIEVDRLSSRPGYDREREGKTIPWGRVGTPEDLCGLLHLLASDASDFITGQVFTVDGGSLCRLAGR